ncbi:unnamed protein product, partial [Mesorhabditis belari]|uniref:Uncharacterized protein n=1 Tax=Mesorhabditis belari TaxID=2138241 RepID=A0AAF3F6A6_9BILA
MSVGSKIGGVIGDLVGGLFGGDDPLDDPREQVKHIEEEMAKQHYCVIQEIKLEIDEATEKIPGQYHKTILRDITCLTDATINGCKNRTDCCLVDFYMSVAADIQIAVGVRQESDYMEMLDGVEDFSLFTNNTWKLFKNFGSPFYGKFIYMAQQTITNETLPDELSELYEAFKLNLILYIEMTGNESNSKLKRLEKTLTIAGNCITFPVEWTHKLGNARQQIQVKYAYELLIEMVERIDGLQTCNYIISKSSYASPDQPHLLQQAKATYGKEDRMWIDSKCFEDTCWSFYLFDLITAELPGTGVSPKDQKRSFVFRI